MVEVITVETPELGDRSYIAHDGSTAVVIDPQRDLDRLQPLLRKAGLTLALVLETHLHNDYVSGGRELASQTGARYVVAAGDDIDFDAERVVDGDQLSAGRLQVEVMATPGHTDGHVAYVVHDTQAGPRGASSVVFSGGCLLYGSVGRTDLVDVARTDELARAQYHSARRLAQSLPDPTPLFPTHGFGSFCSSGSSSGGDASTIGQEKAGNDALVTDDEQSFVDALVAGLTAYPRYYAHMSARNRAGAGAADLSEPRTADPNEIAKRIGDGEWVVDLRSRTAFAARHIDGAIGIEVGQQFATYLGWLIPWGTPVTLVGDSAEQVADAQRQLVRIGIESPAGAAVGSVEDLAAGREVRSYRRVDFAEVARARQQDGVTVLDVRRDDERAGGGLPGSVHIPMHSLLDRLGELPEGQLWVHCASGFRASVAASLLDRAGHDVVLIDDAYSHAEQLGLTAPVAGNSSGAA